MSKKIDLVETVGFVSVVLSLLFLAYQIQQTNQIAIVTAEIEIRNNYAELNEAVFSNPQLAGLLERSGEASFEPDTGELVQLTQFVYRMMNVWIAAEVARDNDLLSDSTFEIVLNDIELSVGTATYMKGVYQKVVDQFPAWSNTDVVKAIEKHLKK